MASSRVLDIVLADPDSSLWRSASSYPNDAVFDILDGPCWESGPYILGYPGTSYGLPSNSWKAFTFQQYPIDSVTIDGPTVVGPNNYDCGVWTASVSGGVTPYQYSWTGLFTSSESWVSGTVPSQGGTLEVLVFDAFGWPGIGVLTVTYDPQNNDYCT